VVQATAFSSFTGGPHRENALELQVGVEYGLLHRLQVGFALPNVATVWTQNEKTTKVGGTAMWGLFNLIDPESAGWGLSFAAIYGQGDDDRAGELVLLAEKPLGDWIIVYNGVFGRSWARVEEFGETDAMFHGLGASYQVSGSVFLGIEAHWHMENSDGSSWETTGRHLRPQPVGGNGTAVDHCSGSFRYRIRRQQPGKGIPDPRGASLLTGPTGCHD